MRPGPALRYAALELAYGNQWIGPVLLTLAGTAILNSSDPGPLIPAVGPAVALLLVASAWLGQAGLRRGDHALSDVAAAAAGGTARLVVARIQVRLSLSLALAGAALTWTLAVVDEADETPRKITSAIAVAAACLLGSVVGSLTAPPIVHSLARGTIAALAAVVLLSITPGSPVHALLNAMLDDSGARSTSVWTFAVGVVAASAATVFAARRALAP